MRRLIMVLCLAMMIAPARAADRDNVMIKFAEVFAAAHLCKSIEPDFVMMAMTAKFYDIDISKGTADFRVVMGLTQNEIAKLSKHSEEVVCATGLFLYGPDGKNAAGLLKQKG